MNDQQLAQAQTIHNDLLVQADKALNGNIDSNAQVIEPGIAEILSEVQTLAQFEIKPFHAASQTGQ